MVMFLGFLLLYTDDGKQIIFVTALVGWHLLFSMPIVYNRSPDFIEIGSNVIVSIFFFFFVTLIAMIVVHT